MPFAVFRSGSGASERIPKSGIPKARGQKMSTNLFFLKLFGHSRDIPAKLRDIPQQKSLISLVSKDIPNFLAPTPSCGRPPPRQKMSGLKSLGLGSVFVPEKQAEARDSENGQIHSPLNSDTP